MSELIRLLTSRVAGPVATVAALILAVMLAVQTVKLSNAHGELTKAAGQIVQLELNLGTCRGNVSRLDGALKVQNDAVTTLTTQSAAWVARSRKEAADARSVAESYRQASRSILTAKPGADKCASADSLILREAGR